MTEITMPSLSDSMQEGTILSWLKQTGDAVAVGDELVEIETDKATMTYESPAEGTLTIVAAIGETLAVGAPIATLGAALSAGAEQSATEAALEPASPSPPEPAQGRTPETPPEPARPTRPAANEHGNGSLSDDVRATPLARRMAGIHRVDLATVEGTGPRGRITRSDVAARAGVELEAPITPTAGLAPPPSKRSARASATGTQELTRTQQLIARRMSEAKATIPEFQVQTEVDLGALLELRGQLKAAPEPPDPLPSLNDFIVRACGLALGRHPRANGSYRDGRFELHERVNVGIAVAVPDALVVPTVTDADQRSLRVIAHESRRLTGRVRDGSITPPELSGATFTVSNLGMYGMTAITPVINPPQAAILGVGAARAVPALRDGELTERQLMTLTLSCDHRILYGADAAEFLSDIRRGLESPLTLVY
ncbi:MAG: dihydrolipoamide acetyltransferase family protein [Solirubrobacteraceae bacterium]